LSDPFGQQRDLVWLKFFPRLGWGHFVVGIIGCDSMNQFALFRMPGNDGRVSTEIEPRTLGCVDPQSALFAAAFSFLRIRAVTLEAVLGKDAPDVAIKIHFRTHRRLEQRIRARHERADGRHHF